MPATKQLQLRSAHRQFYLITYTHTDGDQNRYAYGGGLDLGLSETGLDQARKIARRFKKNPLKIKRMVAGPELRCIQMADLLHDEMKVKLTLSRDFADQNLGEWEGKSAKDAEGANPPRGEALAPFQLRVSSGLEKLLIDESALLTLIVTHERVAEVIFNHLGLNTDHFERGVLYGIDLPAGDGNAHLRVV